MRYQKPSTEAVQAQVDSSIASLPLPTAQLHRALPDSFSFAGELVPLNKPEVREALEYELVRVTYFHVSTVMSLKRAKRWFPLIEPILAQHNIPEDLKYLVVVESNFSQATSPMQAKGFWQFLEKTGLEFGLRINAEVDERYDVLRATEAACLYFKQAHQKFQNWTLAAASYNIGMGGLKNFLDEQGVSNYYDVMTYAETDAYLYRAVAYKLLFEEPEAMGYGQPAGRHYQPWRYDSIVVEQPIFDLVAFAKNHQVTYKELKWHNPWLRTNRLTILDTRRPYVIVLPQQNKK
jgi:hypothetical protein